MITGLNAFLIITIVISYIYIGHIAITKNVRTDDDFYFISYRVVPVIICMLLAIDIGIMIMKFKG